MIVGAWIIGIVGAVSALPVALFGTAGESVVTCYLLTAGTLLAVVAPLLGVLAVLYCINALLRAAQS